MNLSLPFRAVAVVATVVALGLLFSMGYDYVTAGYGLHPLVCVVLALIVAVNFIGLWIVTAHYHTPS